uniref:Uncharacterized protein n=1 Tax=Knipowitschia caucasica TaxID=637954 RepID=A0AAV2M5A0_KNICA
MPNRTERRRFPGEEGASSSANEHDYNNGASGMECSIPAMANELEFPPLPVTPRTVRRRGGVRGVVEITNMGNVKTGFSLNVVVVVGVTVLRMLGVRE